MVRSFFSRKSSRPSAQNTARTGPDGSDGSDEPVAEQEITPPAAQSKPDDTSSSEAHLGEGREVPEDDDGGSADAQKPTPSPNHEDPVEAEQAVVEAVAEMVRSWRAELAEAAKEDAKSAAAHSVALDNVHPGGLASLYADAPTPLSSLVREPTALAYVTKAVGELSDFSQQLEDRHGIVTIHLGVGSASWQGARPAFNVPVLMRQVLIETHADGTITLQLLPGVEVSSRLLGEMVRAGGYLDQAALAQALDGPHGFSPAAALDVVRDMSQVLPGFELREDLSLGILTHPTAPIFRDVADETFVASSPVLTAAATGDALGPTPLRPSVQDPTDRDPWKEVGLGDQSTQVQDVVETLTYGDSYVVNPEPGSDPVGFIASVSGALTGEGKRVLVVASDTHLEEEISGRFSELGVSPIVADFFFGDYEGVAASLEEAMRDASPSIDTEGVERMRVALRRARESLSSYEEQLHKDFSDWGVSPFDALQVLTELTSDPDGPSTRVRLGAPALSALSEDGGQYARELLERASVQGMFSEGGDRGAWGEILLEDSAQVETVLSSVQALADQLLPAVRMQIARVSGQTGLRSATTLAGWGEALRILERVRSTLDQFRPEVFERSLSDFVIATATAQWRDDRGIALKNSRRRQLVKQAKDLVRPGVHVPDLHSALQEAQECRQEWLVAASEPDAWPLVPEGLDDCVDTLQHAQKQIALVAPYLQDTFGDLQTMPLDELCPMLEALASDPNSARLIPSQLEVMEEVDRLGLSDLLADFQARRIDGDLLGLELDLSWWASALGMMLAAEPRLGGFDPELLQGHLREVRALDKAQVKSLGPLLVERVRSRRRDILSLYPDQYTEMVAALAEQRSVPSLFADFSLSWDMLPIVCAGPALVPHLVRRRRTVDTVILAGVEDLPLGEIAPVIARGAQVIVVNTGRKEGDSLEPIVEVLPSVELPARPTPSTGPVTDLVLAHYPETKLWAAVSPRRNAPVGYVLAEGAGMPGPEQVAIESTLGEADAVCSHVEQLFADDPETQLAVVTFSDLHADRVRSTLRRMMVTNPDLRAAIQARGGDRAVVVSPEELLEMRPDHVILSVGFAKTPHGRVIYDFGNLSTDAGIELWEKIAKGTPKDLTVVTTLRSEEIDKARLNYPAERLLVDLLSLAEGNEVETHTEDDPVVPDDLLVDLADRLHGLGLQVVPNLGTGRMRIPLAVGHPEVPDSLLVAVLTDDLQYRNEPSLRVRDRWIPEQLEALGWKVRTELSMAVFIDPNLEAQKIVDLVLDAVDEHYVATGRPVTPAAAEALAAQARAEGVQQADLGEGEAAVEAEIGGEAALAGAVAVEDEADFAAVDVADADAVAADVASSDPAAADAVSSDPAVANAKSVDGLPAEVASVDTAPADVSVPDESATLDSPASGVVESTPSKSATAIPEAAVEAAKTQDPLFERVSVPTKTPSPSEEATVVATQDSTEDIIGTAPVEIVGAPKDQGEGEGGSDAPDIPRGLPLAAYSDDQLDEVALWAWESNPDASHEEVAEAVRKAIGLKRKGAQSESILHNVAVRTSPK